MINRILLAVALLISIIGGGYYFFAPQEASVGTELPQAVALFETSLAAPITTTATTMTLTSNSVRGGGSLSGYNCFTIDEGSAQAEFVCGTVATTTVTGLTRGISPLDGITEDTDLKFAHRRGASVKITDFPILQLLRSQNNGDGTFENILRYAGNVVPTGANDLADVGYVLSVANGEAVSFDSIVVAGTVGETVATGTLVYFKGSDQEWYKVDTDDSTTYQDKSIGLTQGAGTNGAAVSGGILILGRDTTQTGLTPGAVYYASTTAGAIGTATTSQPIGVAEDTSVLYFNPLQVGVVTAGGNNTFTGANTFSGTSTFTGVVTGAFNALTTTFNASGTWSRASTTKIVYVQAWGAGGSGGAVTAGGSEAGGGGGGAYCEYWFTADTASTSQTVTIGAGGAVVTNSAGNVGGNTTFGSLLTAYGGGGGGVSGTEAGGGGGGGCVSAGGTGNGATPGSAGDNLSAAGSASGYNASGGGNGLAAGALSGGTAFLGGAGGGGAGATNGVAGGTSKKGGNGGTGVTHPTNSATAGSQPGGGGGAKHSNGGSGSSGAGGNGRVIVTEFY